MYYPSISEWLCFGCAVQWQDVSAAKKEATEKVKSIGRTRVPKLYLIPRRETTP